MLPAEPGQIRIAWVYGVAGLVGFVAQIVVGIQGRLVPLYSYYRAMAALGGLPPARAANDLPTPRLRTRFSCSGRPACRGWRGDWPANDTLSIRLSSLVLLIVGGGYLAHLTRAARMKPSHRAR